MHRSVTLQQVVTSAAYLLFYRRRSEHPLGGPALEQMLASAAEVDSEAAGSRETSPVAGEGRRLGDSSHNGSSSAYQVGRVRLVGEGGSGHLNPNQDRLQGTRLGNLEKSNETSQRKHEEGPPAYSVEGPEPHALPNYSAVDRDEAVDMDYDDNNTSYSYREQWGPVMEPGWGFNNLNSAAQPPNSAADDMFADNHSAGSNDSTKVVGSATSDMDEGYQDTPMFSDAPQEDSQMRGMRESAPPPSEMMPVVRVTQEVDSDEELPVHEILPPGS